MRPDELCRQLAEPDRLAVFAAVLLGATTQAEVAKATGLPPRQVVTALRRLEQSELVSRADHNLTAHQDAFKQAVRANAPAPEPTAALDQDPSRDTVLRTFLSNGRLTQIPVARRKRRIVLEHLSAAFEPGVRYPEREVDATLRAWHPDYASLRRHLVDEELLARESGVYWRIGGPVVLSGGPTDPAAGREVTRAASASASSRSAGRTVTPSAT